MKLSSILPSLIHDFKSEADLIRAIEEISQKFTTHRERIGDYLKDPRLVSAYTAFYLLTNIPKLEEVFKWMPPDWVEELKSSDLIDLGAGPGTFSFAWKEIGGKGDVYQIELSHLMKEQGKKIWDNHFEGVLHQGSRWEWKTDSPKFLLFGHSANEMPIEVVTDYIEKINPDHILFIEPGTKEFFPKMLAIRNFLLSQNYSVLFPCPNELSCPMAKSESDWCHQFIHVSQDSEVERLSQMARKDRKLLPLTVHAYSKSFKTHNQEERIVRVHAATKFSYEWEVCHNNQLERYQVMQRDLSKSEKKALEAVFAGDSIKTEVLKKLEQSTRVKVIKINK